MNDKEKYEICMASLRAKLKNPPYELSGNKKEAYRAGIKAAMSLIHSVYGPQKEMTK